MKNRKVESMLKRAGAGHCPMCNSCLIIVNADGDWSYCANLTCMAKWSRNWLQHLLALYQCGQLTGHEPFYPPTASSAGTGNLHI